MKSYSLILLIVVVLGMACNSCSQPGTKPGGNVVEVSLVPDSVPTPEETVNQRQDHEEQSLKSVTNNEPSNLIIDKPDIDILTKKAPQNNAADKPETVSAANPVGEVIGVSKSANAAPIKWTEVLFDSVHFAENGNDVIVDLDKVKLSLANGGNPNWINPKHKRITSTLLHFAEFVSFSNDPTVEEEGVKAIKLLFMNGAKLQYCDRIILFFPIAYGKYEIVKILLESGASATSWPKNAIGADYNMTPIEEAISNGHERIANLLISFGATKFRKKDAVQIRFIEAVKYEDIETLKELVKQGAKVNGRNPHDETALVNLLVRFARPTVELYSKILYLLELGADVNQFAEGGFLIHGRTMPLHQAIVSTQFCFNAKNTKRDMELEKNLAERLLKLLIEKDAYISGRDGDEKTPLHMAAKWNNVVGAKMLIEAGAKIMPRDSDGKTPLDYAESAEMIKLLKSHGAKEL